MNIDEVDAVLALNRTISGMSGDAQKAIAKALFPHLLDKWNESSGDNSRKLTVAIWEACMKAKTAA